MDYNIIFVLMKATMESLYANLTEKDGITTIITDWFDNQGIKRLQYGIDGITPMYQQSNVLFFYWWDFIDTELSLDEYRTSLKQYFETTYNKEVSDIKSMYVGWPRKEKDTY